MSSLTVWIIIFFSIFTLLIGGLGFTFWYYLRIFRYKFPIFENYDGTTPKHSRTVRGRIISINNSVGQKVFYIPKLKHFVSTFGEPTGKNTYWLMKGPDGMYYNFVFDGFKLTNGKYSIKPINEDVRSFHTANKKNIEERYNKPKNWPVVLMSFTIIISLLIVFIGGWLMYKEMGKNLEETRGHIQASREVSQSANGVLLSLDNIVSKLDAIDKSGGSPGLRPANNTS